MLNNHALSEQKSNIFLDVVTKLSEIKSMPVQAIQPTYEQIQAWIESLSTTQIYNKFAMESDFKCWLSVQELPELGTVKDSDIEYYSNNYPEMREFLVDIVLCDFPHYDYVLDAYLDHVGV